MVGVVLITLNKLVNGAILTDRSRPNPASLFYSVTPEHSTSRGERFGPERVKLEKCKRKVLEESVSLGTSLFFMKYCICRHSCKKIMKKAIRRLGRLH